MRNLWKILFFLFSGCSFLSAQNLSDFQLRMQNSFLKLYENPAVAIHSAKEIRTEETEPPVQNILSKAYLLQGNYLESVQVALEKSTSTVGDEELRKTLILSREFYELNFYAQTDKIINQFLKDHQSVTNRPEDDFLYAQLFQIQAQNYLVLRKFEEAQKSLAKSTSLLTAKRVAPNLLLTENALIRAMILGEKGNLGEASKAADFTLNKLKKTPRAVYLYSATQLLRADLFFGKQQYAEAVTCLQKALSPLENIDYIPLKNKIYRDLSKNYLVLKNNSEYEIYRKKQSESSKFLDEQKKEARRELIQLNTELSADQSKALATKKKVRLFYVLGLSFLLLLISFFFYVREIQKAKMLSKQIKFFRSIKIPQTVRKTVITDKEISKKTLIIPKETETEILNSLDQFEESKNYLDNNMSLATLSAQLGTNTKYLSEIINKYKDKNFNTYINELRIKHVIQLLATDKSYLQYKISYIAEVSGFTSHSAFTNVFKSVTGFSPNEYMQTLRNSE